MKRDVCTTCVAFGVVLSGTSVRFRLYLRLARVRFSRRHASSRRQHASGVNPPPCRRRIDASHPTLPRSALSRPQPARLVFAFASQEPPPPQLHPSLRLPFFLSLHRVVSRSDRLPRVVKRSNHQYHLHHSLAHAHTGESDGGPAATVRVQPKETNERTPEYSATTHRTAVRQSKETERTSAHHTPTAITLPSLSSPRHESRTARFTSLDVKSSHLPFRRPSLALRLGD